MAENGKEINRLSRTYDEYRNDLINLSKKYYPELADSFNDSSVGAWFIDLISAVGDNLSYHTDRVSQENDVNTMSTESSIKNFARTNSLKIPGPKASMCEVQLSCFIPLIDSYNISSPNFNLAPTVKRGSIVTSGKYSFEIVEDVDFSKQFNADGFSNRTYSPKKNNNGDIIGYNVTKTTVVRGGSTKIYKKVINENEAKPFMEIILPEKDIMNVESIILKESANMTNNPPISEYFVNKEVFTPSSEVKTYRFFEVESLSQQDIFMPDVDSDSNVDIVTVYEGSNINSFNFNFDSKTGILTIKTSNNDSKNTNLGIDSVITNIDYEKNSKKLIVTYIDSVKKSKQIEINVDDLMYDAPQFCIYKGKWTNIKQKFITEYTDNGYLKIIFGSSNKYDEIDEDNTTVYGQYTMSNLINNDMLGLIPKSNCTMYVLYRVGGGEETNIAQGAINSVSFADVEFNNLNNASIDNLDSKKSEIVNSLTVTNLSVGVGGKDAPTAEEIKYLTKYNTSAQDRCVTVKDYQNRVMLMPPKYGCPFRCACIEDNNKILMSLLGITSEGKLSKGLPQALVDNIIEYMSHYRTINDYIEINSGKIYNIKVIVNAFIDKNYDTTEVVKNIINTVKDFFDIDKRQLGEDIFVGELIKNINTLDGVINLIDIEIYSVYNKMGYNDKSVLPEYVEVNDVCNPTQTTSDSSSNEFRIDLSAIDNVLYSDYNSMFEIKNPNSDIIVKCKLK